MGKKVLIIFAIIFTIIIVGIVSGIIWYSSQLKPPKNSKGETILEIGSGTTTVNIVKGLKQNNVIRSELATKIYIKLHNVRNLQAGKYVFQGNESTQEVIQILSNGKIMDESVTITFKEGINMRHIASLIAEKTNNTTEDVYNLLKDEDYIVSLIDKYWFLTDSIKNESIYYPLEGYLYPETYNFENKDITVKEIFEKMLDQTGKILTKYKDVNSNSDVNIKINELEGEKNKYTAHEVLTLASVVELEATSAENRAKVAKVFYNRIAKKMPLQSDVTTYYAIKVDMGERNLYLKEINTANAYNTRGPNMEGKLPVGPICNPSEASIKAVLNPIGAEILFFVSDKNGDMYFSKTNEQHEETIEKLKKRGLWFEY